MSLRFKTNLLEHIKSVRSWARQHNAQTRVDLADLCLHVTVCNHHIFLEPQFTGLLPNGRMGYFGNPHSTVNGFVGWSPNPVQAWDISLSKLAFKNMASRHGLRTPAHWARIEDVDDDAAFLIKRSASAFGYGMRGPFLGRIAKAQGLALADGEFAEAFIIGQIARAWYWGPSLAVIECFAMPTVTGDGQTPYRQLLESALAGSAPVPSDFADIANVQGIEPGTIIESGHSVIADYRYVSPFNPTVYQNHNSLPTLPRPLLDQFFMAGDIAHEAIPGSSGKQFGFVLDAIIDSAQRVWFLEINSNPQGHPDVYPTMLSSLVETG